MSGNTDLRFGCQIVNYGNVNGAVQDAVRAEEAGFDLITVPDHLFHPTGTKNYLVKPPWEAFSVLGAISQHTDSAMLMPGVTDSVRRHPTELAHVTATLDQLSGGRAGFGIGAGEAFNFAPIGDMDWSDPFTRFVESVKVVDALWNSTAEEPVSFDGEFYQLEEAFMGMKPVQSPRPPIWVGGYGDSMRGFTGALADGWFPWIHTAEQYEADLAKVLSSAERRGRNPAEIDRAICIPTTVTENSDNAREAAIERNRTSLALRKPLLAKMGYDDIVEDMFVMYEMAFDREQEKKLEQAAAKIPPEAVDEVTIAGDPARAIERIEEFVSAGVDNLVVIPVGDFEETVRHYEETIIPYFKK